MGQFLPIRILFLASLLAFGCAVSISAHAGDEDVKQEAPKPAPIPEADAPQVEPEPDVPDLSTGEEKGPDFQENLEMGKKPSKTPWSLDDNIDYSELSPELEGAFDARGVLPPALGFRGYRPNMLAIGYGDRMPGWGGLMEFSWNRLGLGVYYSHRRLPTVDGLRRSQDYVGAYGLYRWLPWSFSPYFLIGVEGATNTQDQIGGLAGIGTEVEVYQGWTLLFGYTYHSTAHLGFLGGAFGWSF